MQPKMRRAYRIQLARLRIEDFKEMLKDPTIGAPGGDAKEEIGKLLKKEEWILLELQGDDFSESSQ